MDKLLQSMAHKLNSYDEASLMNLWQRYAQQVHEFEPTKRWEEAALILCFIQAVQWKNRLFNYNLLSQSESSNSAMGKPEPTLPDFATPPLEGGGSSAVTKKQAVILSFPNKKENLPD